MHTKISSVDSRATTRRNVAILPPTILHDNMTGCHATPWSVYHQFSTGSATVASSVTTSSTAAAATSSLIERGLRIRPERANRKQVQRLTWQREVDCHSGGRLPVSANGSEYLSADEHRLLSSMTIADVSPRLALRRILVLFENHQFREAANFVSRLNHSTFKGLLAELPVDLFVEGFPLSLPLLEALYAKVFLSDGLHFSVKLLRPEAVVMQMVKHFAQLSACEQASSGSGSGAASAAASAGPAQMACRKVLKVIVTSEPKVRRLVQGKRRSLDKALEGLGRHGLVGAGDDLAPLHDALRAELEKVVTSYKVALHKLEELCGWGGLAVNGNGGGRGTLSRMRTGSVRGCGPAPVRAGHQRLLSLKQHEIQERLIKNKTLLNVLEPTLANHPLELLLGILQRRIEHDKDVLFQFTQLRREARDVSPSAIVAPVLMRFSQGCAHVLRLMREAAPAAGGGAGGEQDCDAGSDISGYHSDSDSAVMMNGNSPYLSKSARYHFIYRSRGVQVCWEIRKEVRTSA